MLALIRRFLETKAARLFFVVLIVPFVLFGVANVAQNWGGDTALAKVGDRRIEPAAFTQAFRQQLQQASRMLGGNTEPTPAIRQNVGQLTLQQLITEAAVDDQVARMGLVVPDADLREAVFAMPEFRGPAGGFDRQRFLAVLRQTGLTEARVLDIVRTKFGERQLIEAVMAGVAAPDLLMKQVYDFQREKRVAETVELPFGAAPEPAPPTEAELRAAYDNDPQRYAAPAFRRIKLVVLSPATIARSLDVSDADVAAYLEQHRGEFGRPEKRSWDMIVSKDGAVAQRLSDLWVGGADWATVQRDAEAAGASAVQLDDLARADVPETDLADMAFQAAPDSVVGPAASAFGFRVLRVTKVTPGDALDPAVAQEQARTRLAQDRAADLVFDRSNKLEDALSAAGNLDDLPGDLGLAAMTGTLDAKGDTQAGEPAPIPGGPAARQAILTSAFAVAKGEAPRLVEGPDNTWFALVVEDETPPAVRPFDAVTELVRENVLADARRHGQEVVAAKLLAAAKAGGSLDDAATVAGLRVERTPPVDRSSPTPGVAPQLIRPLFALAANEATMVENADGFVVMKLVAIEGADPAADPLGAARIRGALTESMGQDVQAIYATALRDRAKPTVNQKMFQSLVQ